MHKKTVPAISEETVKSRFSIINKVHSFAEHASLYCYTKSDFIFRYTQLIADKKHKNALLGNKKLAVLDCELSALEDGEDLIKATIHLKPHPDILFITGTDSYIQSGNVALFAAIQQYAHDNPHTTVIVCTSLNIFEESYLKIISACPLLTQNRLIWQLYSDTDSKQFISYLEHKWEIAIPEQVQSAIIREFSSHFWLIKDAVRYYRDNASWSIKAVCQSSSMQYKLQHIYNSFSPLTKKMVADIALSAQTDTIKPENQIIDWLIQTGWVKKINNRLSLAIPALSQFIRESTSQERILTVSQNSLYINDVPITDLFSKGEAAVLIHLSNNQGKTVTREQIAKLLWGNQWENEYSDWALDKAISRIRKKLLKYKTSSYIQTKRNCGYMLTTRI